MQQYTLQELLEQIKIEENPYFADQLLKDRSVNQIIVDACKRYRVRKTIVESWIKEYTLKYYVFENHYTEERYKNDLRKIIGRKAIELNGKNKR